MDPVAVAASALAVIMLVVYVAVIRQEDGQLAVWAVSALVVGAVAAGYGSVRDAPRRRAALALGGLVLVVLGALAILSIGLPIILSGALCLVAALRREAPQIR